MRISLAVVMFLVIAGFALGALRSLAGRKIVSHDPAAAEPPPPDVRIVYRCGECGTEFLVLRRGSEAAPRHCGESMIYREEIPRT